MESPSNVRGEGIPFFSEMEWLKAKTVMEDGHTFHDTYAEFVEKVMQYQAQAAGQHQATIRVYIKVDEFIAWCTANGRKVDAKSRATYAVVTAAHNDRGGPPVKPKR